jgi:hypothetical protein
MWHKWWNGSNWSGWGDLGGVNVKGTEVFLRSQKVPALAKWRRLSWPGGERQDWIQPIQRLNRRLLVDTKDRRMLRRVQIQSNNIGCLAFEVRGNKKGRWNKKGRIP